MDDRLTGDWMELPARFGPYTLLRKIGQGGMAEVYVARQQGHLGVERLIALKMIRSGFSGGELARFKLFFQREAQITASMSHQNIIHLLDSEEATAETKVSGSGEGTLPGVAPQRPAPEAGPGGVLPPPTAHGDVLLPRATHSGEPAAPVTHGGEPAAPVTHSGEPAAPVTRRLISPSAARGGRPVLHLSIVLLSAGALVIGLYLLLSSLGFRVGAQREERPQIPARDLAAELHAAAPDAARPADLAPPRGDRVPLPQDRSRARSPRGWATLSVGAKPWARVYLGGRFLGNTPLVDRRVRAGSYLLRIYCPATGRSKQERIKLAPHKKVRRIFDLK